MLTLLLGAVGRPALTRRAWHAQHATWSALLGAAGELYPSDVCIWN